MSEKPTKRKHPSGLKQPYREVLCSWSRAPGGKIPCCGWTGPAWYYPTHLKEKHGGKEYKPPKVGL